MNFLFFPFHILARLRLARLAWLHLPIVALLAFLQRTPAVRVAATTGQLVIASPVGHVLRTAVATVASLGALHTLVGATQFVLSRNTAGATVGTPLSPFIGFTVTGSTVPAGSYRITNLPPGLAVAGANAAGILNSSAGVISGTPTAAGTFVTSILSYHFANATGDSFGPVTVTFIIDPAPPVTPTFTLDPVSRTVATGTNVTFNATATGTPLPTYQWRKDGVAVPGASSPTLTLTNVQPSHAGGYTLVATNTAGSTTSATANLVVTPAAVTAPVFTTLPASQTIGLGGTVVFNALAPSATAYRWQRNNTDLPGATSADLVLKDTTANAAGTYRVIATNTVGSTTSPAAALTVATVATVAPTDLGRLVNLSILSAAGPGARILTVGAVVGPLNFSGSLPLVIRAVGPTLNTAFGIGGVLADPLLTINASGVAAPIASNDNWGGATPLRAAFTAVGAFDLPAASLDSAALLTSTPGGYTVQVTGRADSSGLVIAEIYDHSTARTATSPRLINLSTLTRIDTGSSLAVGFVLRGATSRTVLVRGIGPSLATIFGLGDVMADPRLELFNNDTGAKVTENDNWGGDAQLMDANATVGAFALADISTKDAVLLVTLAPGAYSARVSGVGSSAGTAIIEVYELP